jgi:hypothetical protein
LARRSSALARLRKIYLAWRSEGRQATGAAGFSAASIYSEPVQAVLPRACLGSLAEPVTGLVVVENPKAEDSRLELPADRFSLSVGDSFSRLNFVLGSGWRFPGRQPLSGRRRFPSCGVGRRRILVPVEVRLDSGVGTIKIRPCPPRHARSCSLPHLRT